MPQILTQTIDASNFNTQTIDASNFNTQDIRTMGASTDKPGYSRSLDITDKYLLEINDSIKNNRISSQYGHII